MTYALGLMAVVFSTLLVFSYLVGIWWLDRYEREPFWLVVVTFLWGGLGGTLLGCILSLVMSVSVVDVVPLAYMDLYTSVIVAPLAEEFTKGLIFLVLLLTPFIDNETDGLIYGAATGLGFAVVENLIYFFAVAMTEPEFFYYTLVMRTLFTALMHCISSALLGFAIGYVRHRELWPKLWLVPIVGFFFAVAMHGLWNLLAVLSGSGLVDGEVETLLLGIILVILMSIAMFVITQLSLYREHRVIAKYLAEEAERGVLPKAHAEIIPFWRKRLGNNWLPAHVPKNSYLEATTLLAFRRYQLETSADRYNSKYQKEVDHYRKEVGALLEGNPQGK